VPIINNALEENFLSKEISRLTIPHKLLRDFMARNKHVESR